METDPEDVLMAAVGSVFGKLFLFIVAVWIGCTIGGAGILAGKAVEHGWYMHDAGRLLTAPFLLFSSWLVLNIPFVIFYLMRFIRGDGDGYFLWGLVIGVESFAVMLGWSGDFVQGGIARTVCWFSWLVLLVMLETGIWFIRHFMISRWAHEMAMLRAENAQRRAEREAEERARMELEDLR